MARENVTASILNQAVRVVSRFTGFNFSLVSVSRWSEGSYLVPAPSEPFVAMTRALAAQFPKFPPYSGRYPDVIPHLSVARGTTEIVEAAAAELAKAFEGSGPIRCTCRAAEWIENSRGVWRVMRVIPLRA